MSKMTAIEEFPAPVVDLIDEHTELVITKDGAPIAMVVPLAQSRGPMYGTVEFVGDIVEPLDEQWDADR